MAARGKGDRPKAKGALNDKQKRFCHEYIVDCNAAQAAIRAGYSEKTARQIGARLLTNVVISEYVQELQSKHQEKIEGSAEWVRNMLIENAKKAAQAIPVYDAEGVPTGEYKYYPSAVNKAVELIGKLNGQFVEKVEHSGEVVQKVYGIDPERM